MAPQTADLSQPTDTSELDPVLPLQANQPTAEIDTGADPRVRAARRITTLLTRARDNALGVLFPPICLHCDSPHGGAHHWLCPSCLDGLLANARERRGCPRCSVNLEQRECTCDLVWDHPFERIHSVVDYYDAVRTVMRYVKYRGMSKLAFDLGRRLGTTVPGGFWEGVDTVVPIPLHFVRRMRRGYNQADFFARGVLSSANAPAIAYYPSAIRRTRHTRTQTKLDRDQRRANLAGAFQITPRHADAITGKTVVLVDDVVTTGATTGTCTEALLAAGASAVRVLSLARD
ncbi:MAG: hypothetical protein GF331_04390 [Chitinivibrionales bacterium]|nr:hypothetical protein [Chitinivibrionales bacterium]